MRDGLYKVEFQGPGGSGAGVIVVGDGKIRGGDSAIVYSGAFTNDGGKITSRISIDRHTAGMPSVLGVDKATFDVVGTSNGDSAVLQGTGIASALRIRLNRIGD